MCTVDFGNTTREEIKCMNPNYTEFKFSQIKAHPSYLKCLAAIILLPRFFLPPLITGKWWNFHE